MILILCNKLSAPDTVPEGMLHRFSRKCFFCTALSVLFTCIFAVYQIYAANWFHTLVFDGDFFILSRWVYMLELVWGFKCLTYFSLSFVTNADILSPLIWPLGSLFTLFGKGLISLLKRLFLSLSRTYYLPLVSCHFLPSKKILFIEYQEVFVMFPSAAAAALMSAVYEENKDEDGFLYMTYSGENTFGSFWTQKCQSIWIKLLLSVNSQLWLLKVH